MAEHRAFMIERFGEHLALEQGASERTIEAYGRDLSRLAEWAVARQKAAPVALDSGDLRSFVYHLKDIGLSPSSIRRSVSALRTYFAFLIGEREIVKDPSAKLET